MLNHVYMVFGEKMHRFPMICDEHNVIWRRKFLQYEECEVVMHNEFVDVSVLNLLMWS